MNWIGHEIHDVDQGYGRLIFPLWRGRWLAWFRYRGAMVTSRLGFHNCTHSGW